MRQPWRFSFDREQGNLWIGDVGQGDREEIDFQRFGSTGGENYGWRCMEGTDCTLATGCACADPSWLPPVYEYDHTTGNCCVIGGFVYRGLALPAERGRYFFGDFCSGKIWSMRFDGSNVTEFADRTAELTPCGPAGLEHVISFGEDADGELYVVDGTGGEIFKIVPAGATSWSTCSSLPNSSGRRARISHGGTTMVSADDFELFADDAVAGQFGLFYYGPQMAEVPFGDGLRCIGGSSWRLNPPQVIDPTGHTARRVDYDAPVAPGGQLAPGDTWFFQFWYRGPGGSGFNLSDGLGVTFCP
ncbi:MAG: PQQ-dependent sugar dehydrogenase [Planctomycetota bacterium]|nr:PQQ-dependent sugar dehydrogenase [Planctomycetota bacterium]